MSTDSKVAEDPSTCKTIKKKSKRGIIFLTTIPPYMNVTRIREVFDQYGAIDRVFLRLAETETNGKDKVNKRKIAKKFTEGWVEFEKKSVAKKVVELLNNKQVNTRKNSKHYDCLWNIKYLPGFKWTHLHERLAYEKAARRQKLRLEIELAKKNSNYFTINIDKHKKNKQSNKSIPKLTENISKMDTETLPDRDEFIQSLFK